MNAEPATSGFLAAAGEPSCPKRLRNCTHYGIERIYHPDDGRSMGLQGMINDLVQRADFETVHSVADVAEELKQLNTRVTGALRVALPPRKMDPDGFPPRSEAAQAMCCSACFGITGTGGAGKSSMVDELVRRFLMELSGQAHWI